MKTYTDYNLYKSSIIKELEKLYGVVSSLGNDTESIHLKKLINESIANLESDQFNVAIIGEMCRGKSTIMNAIMDPSRTICKIDLDVNTARPTRFKFNENEHGIVITMDNKSIKISYNDLFDYCDKNGKHVEKTKFIDYFIPNSFLNNGIVLVDTPGVNDPNKEREKVTIDFLRESDAVIFILDVHNQISAAEINFLRNKIIEDSGIFSILFVLNKIDLQDFAEQKEIYDYVLKWLNNRISSTTGEKIDRLIAISAKRYIAGKNGNDERLIDQSNFHELLNTLEDFLISVRGKSKINKVLSKINNKFLSSIKNIINQNNQIAKMTHEELMEKVRLFEREKKNYQSDLEIIKNKISTISTSTRLEIDKRLELDFESLLSTANKLMGEDDATKNIRNLKREAEDFINKESLIMSKFVVQLIREKSDLIFEQYKINAVKFYSKLEIHFSAPKFDLNDFENALITVKKQKGFWKSLLSIFFDIADEWIYKFDKGKIKRKIEEEKGILRTFLHNYSNQIFNEIEKLLSQDLNEVMRATEMRLKSAASEEFGLKQKMQKVREESKKTMSKLEDISAKLELIKKRIETRGK